MVSANLAFMRQNVIEKMKQSEKLSRDMECMRKALPTPRGTASSHSAQLNSLRTEKSDIDRQIDDLTVTYSEVFCQQLCAKILTAFPRELRDNIYQYVVTPDYIYAGPQYLTNEGIPCEKDRDAPFFKDSYVGKMVLVELAQTWYRHTLFYFWDRARNADVVERFMVTDRWGLGIKPHEHISRVRFDLGSQTLHSQGNCGRASSKFCDVDGFLNLLVEPLKSLAHFSIPNRAHFLIRIHTLGSLQNQCLASIGSKGLRPLLEDLLTELKKLRSDGHQFIVQWSELGDLEFSSSRGKETCALTAEAWQKEVRDVVTVLGGTRR
ncbi:hypothetical protein IQ06DRAFT_380326 [Phaeosphaeriaceae sp. SRC1lsM3a]|nr:hypothetical protein IQ06DRAFT_380326 [Stagonospora sp. SRC1lsM3a]